MNRIFYPLLEPAIERCLREMEANPYQASLGMLDFGLKISSDPEHRNTLKLLRQSMLNQNCAYHKLLRHLVGSVNRDSVKAISGNLIRNCLGDGQSRRKKLERAWGHSAPAGAVFDLRGAPRSSSLLPQLDELIRQGEPLGIFSYVLIVDEDGYPPRHLSQLCARHKNCTFMLAFPPAHLSDADLAPLSTCSNLLCTLLLTPSAPDAARSAVQRLTGHRCFVGGCLPFDGSDPLALMQAFTGLGLSFLLLLQERGSAPIEALQAVKRAREIGRYPFVPLIAALGDNSTPIVHLYWREAALYADSATPYPCSGRTMEQIIRQIP